LLAQADSTRSRREGDNALESKSRFAVDISGQKGFHDLYFVLNGKSFMIYNQLDFLPAKVAHEKK
jgi:hypothetical protein